MGTGWLTHPSAPEQMVRDNLARDMHRGWEDPPRALASRLTPAAADACDAAIAAGRAPPPLDGFGLRATGSASVLPANLLPRLPGVALLPARDSRRLAFNA